MCGLSESFLYVVRLKLRPHVELRRNIVRVS
jgi:hypothetical protein